MDSLIVDYRNDNYSQSSWGYIYVFWFVRISFFIILIKIGLDPQSSWGWQLLWILDKRFRGWQIPWIPVWVGKNKEKNTGFPVQMRIPGSISFQIEKKKDWIPNQVGDDSYYWSSIKDFEDDSGCAFEDDSGCAFGDENGMVFGLLFSLRGWA